MTSGGAASPATRGPGIGSDHDAKASPNRRTVGVRNNAQSPAPAMRVRARARGDPDHALLAHSHTGQPWRGPESDSPYFILCWRKAKRRCAPFPTKSARPRVPSKVTTAAGTARKVTWESSPSVSPRTPPGVSNSPGRPRGTRRVLVRGPQSYRKPGASSPRRGLRYRALRPNP
jgi:hypothetical protein